MRRSWVMVSAFAAESCVRPSAVVAAAAGSLLQSTHPAGDAADGLLGCAERGFCGASAAWRCRRGRSVVAGLARFGLFAGLARCAVATRFAGAAIATGLARSTISARFARSTISAGLTVATGCVCIAARRSGFTAGAFGAIAFRPAAFAAVAIALVPSAAAATTAPALAPTTFATLAAFAAAVGAG